MLGGSYLSANLIGMIIFLLSIASIYLAVTPTNYPVIYVAPSIPFYETIFYFSHQQQHSRSCGDTVVMQCHHLAVYAETLHFYPFYVFHNMITGSDLLGLNCNHHETFEMYPFASRCIQKCKFKFI